MDDAAQADKSCPHQGPFSDRPFPGGKMSFSFHLSVDFLSCKMLNETKGYLTISR
jgi:hypothetical protein